MTSRPDGTLGGRAGGGSGAGAPLGPLAKARLALRVWHRWAVVVRGLRREPLPALVARLRVPPARLAPRQPPDRLSRAVDRTLRIGRRQARCLTGSLVLYRLLREQGDAAELVIGLPRRPTDPTAHAWVELAGRVVGPPPGRADHVEMARYG